MSNNNQRPCGRHKAHGTADGAQGCGCGWDGGKDCKEAGELE